MYGNFERLSYFNSNFFSGKESCYWKKDNSDLKQDDYAFIWSFYYYSMPKVFKSSKSKCSKFPHTVEVSRDTLTNILDFSLENEDKPGAHREIFQRGEG